jgi:tetratricopeptide (TPR) repeat protein
MDFFDFNNDDFFDSSELVQQFEEAIKKNKTIFFDQDDFETIIDYYEDIGEFEKALSATHKALEQHPYSATIVLRQAYLEFQLKNCEKALQLVEKSLALDSSEISAMLLKSEILAFQSNFIDAIAILKDLEKTADYEDLIDVYLQFCDIYEDCSNYEEVYVYLVKCLNLDPSNDEAINRMNYCVEILHNYQESIDFHLTFIDKQPYNYLAWYNLGSAYKGINNIEKAIEALEYAIAITNEADFIYIELVELLIKDKKITKALENINELCEFFEPDDEIYILQGKCYDAQKNYKMARYYYRKALHQNPNSSEVYFKLGETYKKERNWEQAYQAYQKAKELEQEQYEFCVALAEAALEIDEIEVGIDACQSAIDIFVKRDEAYFVLAKLMCNVGDLETAEEVLINGISICKNTTTLEYALATVYYLQNKQKEAANKFAPLLENYPEDKHIVFDFHKNLDDDNFFKSLLLI